MWYLARSGTACSTNGSGVLDSNAGEAEDPGHQERRGQQRSRHRGAHKNAKRDSGLKATACRKSAASVATGKAASVATGKAAKGSSDNCTGSVSRTPPGNEHIRRWRDEQIASLHGQQGRDLSCSWECSLVFLSKVPCCLACSFYSFRQFPCGWVCSSTSFRQKFPAVGDTLLFLLHSATSGSSDTRGRGLGVVDRCRDPMRPAMLRCSRALAQARSKEQALARCVQPLTLAKPTRQALHRCPWAATAGTPDRAGVDTTYFTTGAAEIDYGGSCAGAWSCEGRCGALHHGQSAGSTG